MITELPRYTRPQPPEWPGILGFVDQALGNRTKKHVVSNHSARLIIDHLSGPEYLDEEIEANRYYGLGRLALATLQLLEEPTLRQLAVNGAADSLVTVHQQNYPDSNILSISQDPGDTFSSGFKVVAAEANDRTSAHERVAVKALMSEKWRRLQMTERGNRITPSTEDITERVVRELVAFDHSAIDVGMNLLSGVYGLFYKAVHAISYGYPDPGIFARVVSLDHDLADVDPRHVVTLRTAMGASGMRIDEINDPTILHRVVGFDTTTRQTTFNRSNLPISPMPNRNVLHKKRLGCPVREGDGAIKASLELLSEVITAAKNMLK